MKLFKKYRWILLLVIFSLLLRISLYLNVMNKAPYFDYLIFKEWTYKGYSVGLDRVYSVHSNFGMLDIDQPPGTIYILRGSYEAFLLTARALTRIMHLAVGSTLWINDNLLIFFFRLPSIIADLVLGFCIYIMVKSKANEKIALFSSAFFLLGPPIIYNSTIWGQIDSINNLFFYLSLMFLIKKRAFFSVLCFAISLFIKLSFLPLLPLYLLLALSGIYFRRISFIISVAVTSIIILVLCFPFSSDIFWLLKIMEKSAYGMNQDISVNAFNFWWLIFNPALHVSPPPVTSIFLGLSLSYWAYLISASLYLPIVLYLVKLIKIKKLSTEAIFLLTAMVIFISFLFLPKMHERYLYPVFPLLMTWIGFKNKYWLMTALLSFIHFLNLYIVWNPSLILFREIERTILSQNTKWILSLATIILFYFYYMKIFTSPKLSSKSSSDP